LVPRLAARCWATSSKVPNSTFVCPWTPLSLPCPALTLPLPLPLGSVPSSAAFLFFHPGRSHPLTLVLCSLDNAPLPYSHPSLVPTACALSSPFIIISSSFLAGTCSPSNASSRRPFNRHVHTGTHTLTHRPGFRNCNSHRDAVRGTHFPIPLAIAGQGASPSFFHSQRPLHATIAHRGRRSEHQIRLELIGHGTHARHPATIVGQQFRRVDTSPRLISRRLETDECVLHLSFIETHGGPSTTGQQWSGIAHDGRTRSANQRRRQYLGTQAASQSGQDESSKGRKGLDGLDIDHGERPHIHSPG
jgi:hypothetical protein